MGPEEGDPTQVSASPGSDVVAVVPLVVVALLVLDAAVSILPADPLFWLFTLKRLLVLAGLAALVAAGARLRHFRSPLDLPVALLLLSGLIATVVGRHDGAPLRALLTSVAFYYLCVGLLRLDSAAWQALVFVALVSAVVAGTAALAQVETGTVTGFCRSPSLRDVPCGSDALVRATGTFANPNLLAAAILLLAPLAALTVATRQRSARWMHLLLVALAYAGLLVTYSRGAYGSAAASAVTLGLLLVARGRAGRGVVMATLASLGVLLVLSVAIFLVSGPSLLLRGQLWEAALRQAIAHPLAGVGLGRGGAVVTARVPGPQEFAHAHNFWLNWFLETGVLGLLAALLLTGLSLLAAARLAARGSAVGTAGLVALVGFFLLSVTDHPVNNSRIATLLWFVLALVAAEVPVATRRRAAYTSRARRDS
jgi:O-antigen ligase